MPSGDAGTAASVGSSSSGSELPHAATASTMADIHAHDRQITASRPSLVRGRMVGIPYKIVARPNQYFFAAPLTGTAVGGSQADMLYNI
jgi:hypothetical protein